MYNLVELINEVKHQDNGKVATRTTGYVLKNTETGEVNSFSKTDACLTIKEFGSENVMVCSREPQTNEEAKNVHLDGLLYYLKPSDGKKLSEYLSEDIKKLVNKN